MEMCIRDRDSISNKNDSYCELTGMYWALKNLKNVDVIGLCHYRRYFDFHKQCKWPYPITCLLYTSPRSKRRTP